MGNVRNSKINLESVKEFLVRGCKQLLVSLTTLEQLSENGIPLVERGPLPKDELEEDITRPKEITPETPLIKGDPSNLIVNLGSAIAGFDVTGPTPATEPNEEKKDDAINKVTEEQLKEPNVSDLQAVLQPNLKAEKDVEMVINQQVSETPKREAIGIENIELNSPLETPQAFNDNLPKQEIPQNKGINPYVLMIDEIERVRTGLKDEINKLEKYVDLNLDNLSRNVEKVRQISQNDANAYISVVQNGINSLNEKMDQNNNVQRR